MTINLRGQGSFLRGGRPAPTAEHAADVVKNAAGDPRGWRVDVPLLLQRSSVIGGTPGGHVISTVQLLNKLAIFNRLKKYVRRHYTATVPPGRLPARQDPPRHPLLLRFPTSLRHFEKNKY